MQLDNGKTARWNWQRFRHLDFGYVMTSHSSQSMTVDRCLVNVETGNSRLRALHNSTFAYVSGSRPEFDLQIFTDDTAELLQALSRQQEKHKAHSPEQIRELAKTGAPAKAITVYEDETKISKMFQDRVIYCLTSSPRVLLSQ